MKTYNLITVSTLLFALGIICPACEAHPAFKVQSALEALEAGDLDKAESLLQISRFEEPDSYEINYNLGIVSYRKRDYAKSVRLFARASELVRNPDESFNTFYNMGNAAFKGYDFALAVTAYKNALAVKNDYQAEYNLKIAEKKLQEQLDRMKKEQEQQQNQNQQQQNGQQQGQQNQQQNGQQDQQQNGQQGQQQNGQQQGQQQNGQQGQQQNDEQQGQQNQQQNGQQEQQQNSDINNDNQQSTVNNSENVKEGEGNEEKQSSEDNKENEENNEQSANSKSSDGNNEDEENKDEQQSSNSEEKENNTEANASDSAQLNNEETASASAPINETTATPEADRRDLQMAEDKGKVGRPEASQKARAMKNIKLNKKDVEAYLKEMEAREAEAQKYYRINNISEKNPEYMNQEELREWLKIRNRKKEKARNNEQDW